MSQKRKERTEITVNKYVIGTNNKAYAAGEEDLVQPPIRVQTNSRKPEYATEVHITGKVVIKYDHASPRPCGAKVWIETEDGIEIIA